MTSARADGTKRRSGRELRLRNLVERLFGTLINPGANQSDLVFGERIALVCRGHPIVFVSDPRDVVDEGALGAVACFDHFSVLAAFEGGGEAVEAKLGFLFIRSVAFETRFLENRFDIGSVSHSFFARSGRELAGINRFRVFVGGRGHCRNARK